MTAFRIDKDVSRRVRSLPELMRLDKTDIEVITETLDSRFRRNENRLFSSEGASGGAKWPALSPRYAAAKRRKYPGRKIMQRKGDLRRSLVNRGDAHVAFGVLKPRPAVTLGTRDGKAAWHGPDRRFNQRGKVRDVLQHTPRQEHGYLRLVADHYRDVKLPRLLRVLQARKFLRNQRGRR